MGESTYSRKGITKSVHLLFLFAFFLVFWYIYVYKKYTVVLKAAVLVMSKRNVYGPETFQKKGNNLVVRADILSDEVLVVSFGGHLVQNGHDLTVPNSLTPHLECGGDSKLVIDLEGVLSVDSTGLATVLKLVRFVTEQRGRAALANCASKVLDFIKLTKLDHVLHIEESLEQALAAVNS